MLNRHLLKVTEFILKPYISICIRLSNYKRKNKPHLLIFTDSRGFDVTTYLGRKNPLYKSYVAMLMKDYHVTVKVCPNFSTTTIDFLDYYNDLNANFDAVILHTGLVEFSVRPISMIKSMWDEKKYKENKILKKGVDFDLSRFPVIEKYRGMDSSRYLTIEDMDFIYNNNLSKIKNLIWIGINPVLKEWDGTYWNSRPEKINDNLILDEFIGNKSTSNISLSKWNPSEIKKYTVDNIHLSAEGFKAIYSEINERLKLFNYDK